MKKRIFLGLTLVLALAAPAAQAAPSAKLTRQVHTLLNAPEHVPSAAEWQKLGPDAAEVLRSVALDEKTLLLRRGRAATALAYFPSTDSKAALVALVGADRVPWLLRGKAAGALAAAWRAEALAPLAPLLAHDHKRLREAAVKAVGLVETDEARALLEARLAKEKNDSLKKLIQATLARMEKKGGQR
jgi:hypothetical protein